MIPLSRVWFLEAKFFVVFPGVLLYLTPGSEHAHTLIDRFTTLLISTFVYIENHSSRIPSDSHPLHIL